MSCFLLRNFLSMVRKTLPWLAPYWFVSDSARRQLQLLKNCLLIKYPRCFLDWTSSVYSRAKFNFDHICNEGYRAGDKTRIRELIEGIFISCWIQELSPVRFPVVYKPQGNTWDRSLDIREGWFHWEARHMLRLREKAKPCLRRSAEGKNWRPH